MAPKFGTSGLRGLVSELTDELCARHTRAFLSVVDHDGLLLTGSDLRPSSRQHLRAVAAGARALGVAVLDCGALPTPALALEAMRRGAPAVMVTGSHIPADRNGLKFYTRTGEITKADETAILAALDADAPDLDLRDPPADHSPAERYLARFHDFFAPDALAGLAIGVYEHSAVGRDMLGALLRGLGAVVTPLGRSEVFIPVDTEAVDPDASRALLDWAAQHRLDALVSLDGDSDRPLVTDARGTVIPGDILGAMTARLLGASHVVAPVSANTMVDSMGFAVTRTRIGSPYVISGIETVLAADPAARVVGFEPNGGFLTGFAARSVAEEMPPLLTRDAFLPILCVLSEIRSRGPLADIVAALPPRRTATDRLAGLPTEVSAALIARLTGDPNERADLLGALGAEAGIDTTDGLRITYQTGTILHLRPSGNAPELRCYAECDDSARAATLVQTTLAAIADRHG